MQLGDPQFEVLRKQVMTETENSARSYVVRVLASRRQAALLIEVQLPPPFNQNLDEAYLSLTITGLRFI